MAILLVEHDTTEPALYGAMAAAVAQGRGARLVHLAAVFDTRRYADAVQHIAAIGALDDRFHEIGGQGTSCVLRDSSFVTS